MTRLQKLQRNFISDCLRGELTDNNILMAPDINIDIISAKGRMGIYRESALGNILLPMQLTYPVVEKLVGEDFFRTTCYKYTEKYWPTTGDMDDYGAEFADFLENFKPAESLQYLADVARLEWLFHQSSIADDCDILDADSLTKYSPEQLADLCFDFHNSVYFISSPYPIHKIWEMNQDGSDSDTILDISQEQGSNLLLVRTGLKVNIIPLSGDEFTFVNMLYNGNSLCSSFEAAIQKNDAFDMQSLLKKLICFGALARVTNL